MYIAILLSSLLALASTTSQQSLNLTAIAAANGESLLECWQLSVPFVISSQPGTSGVAVQRLGDISNATYTVLPPGFDGGLHNAPAVQYVAFLSGLAHITLPNSTEDAWVRGGKNGLIIAADTAAVSRQGHFTTYPSTSETVALQIVVEGGKEPEHTVLHAGPCEEDKTKTNKGSSYE